MVCLSPLRESTGSGRAALNETFQAVHGIDSGKALGLSVFSPPWIRGPGAFARPFHAVPRRQSEQPGRARRGPRDLPNARFPAQERPGSLGLLPPEARFPGPQASFRATSSMALTREVQPESRIGFWPAPSARAAASMRQEIERRTSDRAKRACWRLWARASSTLCGRVRLDVFTDGARTSSRPHTARPGPFRFPVCLGCSVLRQARECRYQDPPWI